MYEASIIIRTKNEEDWIYPCIKAIKKQNIKNVEIILVDNFSEDKTCKIAKDLGVNKILKIKNYFPGKAINQGIEKANSNNIIILSAHCIPLDKNWIAKMIKPLLNSKIAGVYGKQIPLPFTSADDQRDLILTFGNEDKLQKKDYFFHNANSAIKRNIWLKNKFDNKISNIEDRDWGKKIISRGYQLYYSSEAAVYHYHGLHQHEKKISFRANSVVSVMKKIDVKEFGFPDELKINVNDIPVFIPIKDNRYNKPLYKKVLKRIIKQNKLKKVFIYGSKENARFFEIPYLDRSKSKDSNKDLRIVLKNALNIYEKKFNVVPRAIIFVAPSYINPLKNIIKTSIHNFCIAGFSSIFPAYEDYGSYWIEEFSNIKNIETKKNPIDKGSPLYKACYGLGSIFRSSSVRKGDIFGKKIGIKKFYDLKNTLRD